MIAALLVSGNEMSPLKWLGLFTSLVGISLYVWMKYRDAVAVAGPKYEAVPRGDGSGGHAARATTRV